jgi:hypothetical protein|uniref:Uncharacterized protein n=1 Tax=viral metagenome TaxID=1070528 RepID=A0A6C0HEL9_9ZZZZ
MNLSSSLVILLIIIGIITFISSIILKYLRPSYIQSLTPKSGRLESITKIGTPGQVRDLFLAPSGSTLSIYIYCNSYVKTKTLGQDSEPIRILQLGNSLQLQLNPANKKIPSSTNLVVKTQGPTSDNEYIPIMDFPQQQWVHLCIVREGRRYTIFYNGRVAGSSRTKYFPTINSSPFIVGDQRLQGTFAFPKLAPIPYNLNDIKNDLQSSSDTRHKPYYLESSMNIFESFSFTCPKGIFCFSTKSQPNMNPLKLWKSPYA